MTGEKKTGRIISGIAAGVIAAGALAGGVAAYNGVQSANASQAAYVASDHAYSTAMAQSASDDQQVLGDAVQRQHINQVNAQVQAAEDAKAAAAAAAAAAAQQAAEAAAARQQADAEAQAASNDDSGSGDDSSGGSSGGTQASGQPSGTPLPMAQVTDPNNGHYGQMVPTVDPASWCANHSASTINGVPTCD